MRIFSNARTHFVVALAVLATSNPIASAQNDPAKKPSTAANSPLAQAKTAKTTSRALIPIQPNGACPQFSLPPSQSEGHHSVTLTWTASSSATSNNQVLYCLYRRQTPNLPSDITVCTDCELVTPYPVAGTVCTDEFVEDLHTYYYVAIAGNGQGLSTVSNEAKAQIGGAQVKTPPPSPSCRGGSVSPAASKPPK
jgi:hypothetical protein